MADFPNYRDDPLQRPQMGGESPFGRATHECRFETLQRDCIEPRLATGAARPAQPSRPMVPPRRVPPAGGFTGHTELADDVGLTLAARKQSGCALSSGFQSREISSGAKGGRHGRIVACSPVNVTILRKHH